MAHSHFVNAFSWTSKNYVFRFQVICHIDDRSDVTVFLFSFRGLGEGVGVGAGGGSIWYFIQLQCTYSKVKFKGNPQCSNVRSFVLVFKNNEAVLEIK